MKSSSPDHDLYVLLGVEPTASNRQIKTAFRALALDLHPDKLGTLPQAQRQILEERYRLVYSAYEILSNPSTRKDYDRQRQESDAESRKQDVLRNIDRLYREGAIDEAIEACETLYRDYSNDELIREALIELLAASASELASNRSFEAAVKRLRRAISLATDVSLRERLSQDLNIILERAKAEPSPPRVKSHRGTGGSGSPPGATTGRPPRAAGSSGTPPPPTAGPTSPTDPLGVHNSFWILLALAAAVLSVLLYIARTQGPSAALPSSPQDSMAVAAPIAIEAANDARSATPISPIQVAAAEPVPEWAAGIVREVWQTRELASLRLGDTYGDLRVGSDGQVTLGHRRLVDVRDRLRLYSSPGSLQLRERLIVVNWDDDKGGFETFAIRLGGEGVSEVRPLEPPPGAESGCGSFTVVEPLFVPNQPWVLFVVSPVEGTATIIALNVDTGNTVCQPLPDPRLRTREEGFSGFKLTPILDTRTVGLTYSGISMLFTFRCSPWGRPCDDKENDVVRHDVVVTHLEFETGRATNTRFRSRVPFEANATDRYGWRYPSEYVPLVLKAGAFIGNESIDEEVIQYASEHFMAVHGARDSNEYGPNAMYLLLTRGSLDSPAPGWYRDAGSVSRRLNTNTPLRMSGVGPIEFGMAFAEANRRLGGLLEVQDGGSGCGYARVTEGMGSIEFMVQDGFVVRADVHNDTMRTADGIRVGSTEAEVVRIYGENAEVTPHRYLEGGRYISIREPAGGEHGFVFETDGEVVTQFRAGLWSYANLVERCS